MRVLAWLTNDVVNRIAHRIMRWSTPRPREHSAEGGSLEGPTGGHMNTPYTLHDKDVEGQDEDGELSRREGQEIEGKEG